MLKTGESFESGFLEAINSSNVIILLISEDGIKQIENANKNGDNMLLEIEHSLENYSKGRCHLLPLLIGKTENKGQTFHKFNGFNVDRFPEQKHCHKLSKCGLSVRETIERLFKVQGEFVFSESFSKREIQDLAMSKVVDFENLKPHPEFKMFF